MDGVDTSVDSGGPHSAVPHNAYTFRGFCEFDGEELDTSNWTAAPAVVNTLLTSRAAASSNAVSSTLQLDVLTTSAPAPAPAPPSTASAAVNKSAPQETVPSLYQMEWFLTK